jgi:DNA-binding response OmpR family regulator
MIQIRRFPMYNILIVDDEEMIRRLISKYAAFEGHTFAEAGDGMEAVEMCKSGEFDIMIIDIMMPELDGFSACRMIRKFSDIPIIMLSARGEEYDRINGFELGIDDYVVKPFSPKELMLRIDAVMKRYNSGAKHSVKQDIEPKNEIIELSGGGLRADITARIVYVDGKRADMTPKEYDLFFYMLKNKNIALTREILIFDVWGYDYYGDDRTLDTHIKLLRKSLGKYSDYIVTLRGVGYRFDVED